jgi:hypothetical protein
VDPVAAHRLTPEPCEPTGEDGFTTVQYVATIALTMLLLVLFANVLVDLYARGAVRDALDEGVRAAAPHGGDVQVCEARAAEVMSGLLHGPFGRNVDIDCETEGGVVRARAHGSFPSWLPGVAPSWHVALQAEMRVEQ